MGSLDDSPRTRLRAVLAFCAFVVACAPVAYWLSTVEKYYIDHGAIAAHASAPSPLWAPGQGGKGIGDARALVVVAVKGSSETSPTEESSPMVTGCARSVADTWGSDNVRRAVGRAVGSGAAPLVTADPHAVSTPQGLFDWLDSILPTDTPPLPPQSFETAVIVADAPALTPANVKGPPVFFGPGRRAIVVIPCSSSSSAAKEILSSPAMAISHVLPGIHAKDSDVVTASLPSSEFLTPHHRLDTGSLEEPGAMGQDEAMKERRPSNILTERGGRNVVGTGMLGWSGRLAAASLRRF